MEMKVHAVSIVTIMEYFQGLIKSVISGYKKENMIESD